MAVKFGKYTQNIKNDLQKSKIESKISNLPTAKSASIFQNASTASAETTLSASKTANSSKEYTKENKEQKDVKIDDILKVLTIFLLTIKSMK